MFLDELKNIKIPLIKFNVNEFYLMESVLKPRGPVYKIIEKYNLKS
jgi:2'-5' RNA ligase